MIGRALAAWCRVLIGLTASVAVAAHGQALTAAEAGAVDRVVAERLAVTRTPAASVAIVRGGKIAYRRAYGFESPGRAAAVDTRYPIASISKQFVAAAVLLLARDGKLGLDDAVAKYIPELHGGEPITIRQLLDHSSGLRDYWPQGSGIPAMAQPTSPAAIIARWATQPLDFAPGTGWRYSNTGYVVAGTVVERVARQPLFDVIERRLLAPLGIAANDADRGAPRATGYTRFALGPPRIVARPALGWSYAAGALAMTASDLARWDIARLERRLLSADDWNTQETPLRLPDGSSNGYGLGVQTGTAGGHRYVEHSGRTIGFAADNIVFPDDDAAIVVLVNSDAGDAPAAIVDVVSRLILPGGDGDPAEVRRTATARAVFDGLRRGVIDRQRLTPDALAYFGARTLDDYRTSLAAVGEPTGFALARPPISRGGFIERLYRITCPGQQLDLVTLTDPADADRFEQLIVEPVR